MNDRLDPFIKAQLGAWWPASIDVDHFAREEAKRERARELQLMTHPDPMDPDHPEDDE